MRFLSIVIVGLMLSGCGKENFKRNPLLRTIEDVNSSDTDVFGCLRRISTVNVGENAGFWLKIVGDSRYSDFRRRECMFALFNRHVVRGMPISELRKFNPVLRFSSSNLVDVSPFAINIPIQNQKLGSTYMFQDALLAKTRAAIYLKLSAGINQSELLQVVQGWKTQINIVIQEVGVSQPENK